MSITYKISYVDGILNAYMGGCFYFQASNGKRAFSNDNRILSLMSCLVTTGYSCTHEVDVCVLVAAAA